MKFKNGKIVEATELELFDYYLSRGFDDFMSFTFYMKRCEDLGTVITEKEENMRPKKLPQYTDVIFETFGSAWIVRNYIMDILKDAKKNYPKYKHFISVSDLINNLYNLQNVKDIKIKNDIFEEQDPSELELADGIEDFSSIYFNTEHKRQVINDPDEQRYSDNRNYGWTKRPGIYEVENGNPSAGYIFEEPVYLF